MNIKLSVIIVNYNGLQFLNGCLNALYTNLKNINYEIIVIDNNSSDASCDFIKENHKQVILIESAINHGFGKGNNEAVKQAKGDYLLLLNNDTILLEDIIPAVKLLESDSSIGVIGINMLSANKEYLPAAGNFPNYKNMFQIKKLFDLGKEFKTGFFSKDKYEVDWLGGSFLLLFKETYTRIGGFDEDYFMYVEDVDFCKKIANINLKRVFLPRLKYIHFVGFNKKKNPLIINGYKIYLKKHKKGLAYLFLLLLLNFNAFIKKIKSLNEN